MGLAQTIVAALGILLWGIAPATAGADGGGGGNAVSEQSGSKGAVPEHGPVSDLLNAKDRLDPVASGPPPDVRATVEKLRKLAPAFVQKPVCHPRDPHDSSGSSGLTPVRFSPGSGRDDQGDNEQGDDDDQGQNGPPGHDPPFCPSPH
jgi:hypothetical protein